MNNFISFHFFENKQNEDGIFNNKSSRVHLEKGLCINEANFEFSTAVLISFGYRRHKALGQQGFPGHCGHKWQCCPASPEGFYFTAMWLGSKMFLKCFHLTWGFPLELHFLPFIIMKQNSVDWAIGLSPNFLPTHLLISIFFSWFTQAYRLVHMW